MEQKSITAYVEGCCSKRCLWNVPLQQCIEARKWYKTQTALRSREWMKDIFVVAKTTDNKLHLRFHQQDVCQTAFKKIYGISNNKFQAAQQEASTPFAIVAHGNLTNQNALRPKQSVMIHTWLDEFITNSTDQDPVSDKVYIPTYINHQELYEMFKTETLLQHSVDSITMDGMNLPDRIPSQATFFRYFNEHFSHVKFLKQTRLGRCTFCIEIGERRKKITSPQELADFKEAVKQHHLLHTSERTMYESRCAQSLRHPENFLSLVVVNQTEQL